MEKETMDIESLISEIFHSPLNNLSKEALRKLTYMELIELRDGAYGLEFRER